MSWWLIASHLEAAMIGAVVGVFVMALCMAANAANGSRGQR